MNMFSNRFGFTLVELAMAIVIFGLIVSAGVALYASQLEQKRNDKIEQTFRNIQAALTDYLDEHGFYPCPAPQDALPDTAVFGRATDCSDDMTIAPGSCSGGLCVSDDFGRRVRIGTVPIRDLNLSVDEMVDPYGSRITYAVTEHLAIDLVSFDDIGAIDVVDGNGNSVLSAPGTAHFVLFSHGPDRVGAFTVDGGLNGQSCSTGTKDNENCDKDSTFRSTEYSTSESGERFDDQIRHSLQFGQINVACPSGEVLIEIRNRQPICQSLQSLSCPDGHALTGFGVDGSPQCTSFQSIVQVGVADCQNGEVLTKIGGAFSCVAEGTVDPGATNPCELAVISGCYLSARNHTDVAGTCVAAPDSTCQYQCLNAVWVRLQNDCM